MRGIAMLGALAELQQAGWLTGIRRFAGTSVGAVLAAVLATHKNLDFIFERHVKTFKYPAAFDLSALDKSFGLDTGDGLRAWIDTVLREPITFQEVQEKYGSTLLVCATNLNTRASVVFGPETHPTMDVATALRMSCSVPLYFAAKTYEKELYVDGALTDNFPVEIAAGPDNCRVLGVRVKTTAKPAGTPWTLDTYLGALVESVITQRVPGCIDTAILDLELGSNTQPLNFKMSSPDISALYTEGRAQGKQFLVSYSKKHH